MRSNKKKEKGLSIALVLMIILIMVVVALAVATISMQNLNFADGSRNKEGAYFAAIAGLEMGIYNVYDDTSWAPDDYQASLSSTEGTYSITFDANEPNFSTNNVGGSTAVTRSDGIVVEAGYMFLVSVGECSGKQERVCSMIQVEIFDQDYWKYAAFGDQGVACNGNIDTESFDSRDVYPYANEYRDAPIGTNAISSNAINITGSQATIYGNIDIGVGGNINTVVSNWSSILGAGYTAQPMIERVNMPPVINPLKGPSLGDVSYDDGRININKNLIAMNYDHKRQSLTSRDRPTPTPTPEPTNTPIPAATSTPIPAVTPTIPPESTPVPDTGALTPGRYGDMQIEGGEVHLTAGSYSFESMQMSGNAVLVIDSGPVTIYVNGDIQFTGNAVINNSTHIPSNCIIKCTNNCTTANVVGSSNGYYCVYAPNASVDVGGNGTVKGSVVGKDVTLHGGASDKLCVIYDRALSELAQEEQPPVVTKKSFGYY